MSSLRDDIIKDHIDYVERLRVRYRDPSPDSVMQRAGSKIR
jgi:hypothetical protein